MGLFSTLLDTTSWPARWHCGAWTATHGWVHVVSDVAIFGAYMAIPIVIAYFALQRRDVMFLKIFWLFAAFILLCGVGHLVEATLFWQPWYRLSGALKASIAVGSWATVGALIPIVPQALRLPGLAKINAELEHEIAERRRAEANLAQLARIVACSNDAIVGIALDGSVVTWNGGAERLFGYRAEEMVGRPVADLVPEDRVDERTAIMERAGKGEASESVETVRLRADGSRVQVSLSVSPLVDSAGEMVGVASVVRDITELKAAELARLERYATELEQSNQRLQRFAFVASHDLQAPLRTVASYTQLLARDYKGKLDATADKHITYAVEAAHRMRDLINDLLEYSRIGAGDHVFKPVDLKELVGTVLADLATDLEARQATVEIDGELPTIPGSTAELGQVFQNLIGNATKFRRDDEPSRVRLSARREDSMWQFAVADNGIGIEAKYCDRIFEVFERLHGRGEYPGTGIGLAIVKRVVERHGGRVWIESEPGRGTTFFFTLPAETVDDTAHV